MKSRNPFLEALFVFSFVTLALLLWITATRFGLLPLIQKSIPALGGRKLITQIAIIIGLILPTIWLFLDWSKQPIRIALFAFLLMQGLQIGTEFALSRYFSTTLIIPAGIVYVGYRLFQLIRLQKLVLQTTYKHLLSKLFRSCIILANLIVWGIVLARNLGWRLPVFF